MHLWDIVGKRGLHEGTDFLEWQMVMKVPNGQPLPQRGFWTRLETAISEDEAIHQLNTKYAHITQPKC